MSPSTRILRSRLLLFFILAAFLLVSSVHAQEEEFPEPEFPEPEVPIPSPSPSPSSSTSASEIPSSLPTPTDISSFPPGTSPTSTSAAPPVSTVPVREPIFSTSDTCVNCKAHYRDVVNCNTRLSTGNLTMINQVLPFYQCVCPNDGALINVLQNCSVCLRSTGQQVFLPPSLYEVTNQTVRAMKQVCVETQNGSTIPSGSARSWDLLLSTASWGILSTLLLTVLSM